jgi:hypothetical protein
MSDRPTRVVSRKMKVSWATFVVTVYPRSGTITLGCEPISGQSTPRDSHTSTAQGSGLNAEEMSSFILWFASHVRDAQFKEFANDCVSDSGIL